MSVRMTGTMLPGVLALSALLTVWAEFVVAPVPQNVPELLKSERGERIDSPEMWEKVRRPELVRILQTEEYGVRPVDRPSDLSFAETRAPESACDGKAIRKRVRTTYSGPGGASHFDFSVWIPRANRPVAAFVHSSPRPAETAADTDGPRPIYWLPVDDIVSRGYAVVAYCNQEVALDWHPLPDVPTSGVFKVFGPADFTKRRPDEWGILSAWAWGMSRILDWIETEPLLDAQRVAAVGLSRNGKAALVAGAFDTRFAMTISCCSGCSGAKLNHMDNYGSERIRDILVAHKWFAAGYGKYVDRDKSLPFDQHFLLALVAPRLLYVSSATEDAWAGPRGEFAALELASPVWNLYGLPGLIAHGFPAPNHPQAMGHLGYHLREGFHDITRYDWARYMDFADSHGWNLKRKGAR